MPNWIYCLLVGVVLCQSVLGEEEEEDPRTLGLLFKGPGIVGSLAHGLGHFLLAAVGEYDHHNHYNNYHHNYPPQYAPLYNRPYPHHHHSGGYPSHHGPGLLGHGGLGHYNEGPYYRKN